MPRYEAQPHAAAALALPGYVGNGSARHLSTHRGTDHAAHRSISRWTLLRRTSRWISRSVDALLLDIWPSRSLRARYSCLCLYVRNHSGIFPETDLRVSGHGCGNDVHRVREHERVGAPHVHGRNELLRE